MFTQPSAPPADFASDVADGLRGSPKQLQPKYFYDALGSSLFEAICRLPWYRITRAEHRLLAQHAPAIASALADAAGDDRATVIELGCGKGEKLARLARALDEHPPSVAIHLVDVSKQALRGAERRLHRFPRFTVSTHQTTYEDGLRRAAASRPDGPAMVLFLGSNIGNFDPRDAAALISDVASSLRGGDLFLLGADLVKPEANLVLAYDDPLGVTAAFNKNVLVRINRELGADFDLDSFHHEARWNADESRIEMHLVSRRPQRVAVPAADLVIEFEAGESIWTESSYKYETDQIAAIGAAAGFSVAQQWVDQRERFALTLFAASEQD
jgi:L-histidine N-alpha-methyltransferase